MLNIKFLSLILSGLVFCSTACASIQSVEKEQFTLATYNVKNLFDGIQNPGKRKEKPKPEAELIALGEAIKRIDADVIALQEVEDIGVLTQFRNRYLKGSGYQHIVLEEANDSRGIDVAVLSRFKILDYKSHKDVRFRVPDKSQLEGFSRDLLQVKISAHSQYQFTLFVAHLKSHWGGKVADAKRKAEADKIQAILNDFEKNNPQANYVLVGDFNDTPDQETLKSLLVPTSEFRLYDCMSSELGKGIYTYHPQKYRSRIDYILLSQAMKAEYIKQSVKIHQAPDGLFKKASDHLPVTAQFNVSKDK